MPAKKFFEIVKSLPETDIRIVEDKGGVKIAADRFDSRLADAAARRLPDAPGIGWHADRHARSHGRQGNGRQNAVRHHRRGHALLPERCVVRPEGRRHESGGDRWSPPGVGQRRAQRRQAKADDESKAILPKKTLGELGRLLGEGDSDIGYERGENHLFFQVGERMLISRMIDGQFPAYERVIPKGNDKHIEFERDRLTNAVKRVALLSNERSRAVKIQIEKGKVDVTSSSPDLGEAKETLPVEYSGSSMQICFNAQYVLDFLAAVATDVVSLELKDEVSQAVMKPVGAEGYDYTYVIMPMRV